MLTDTTRRLTLLALLTVGMTGLHLTDGHSILTALTLGIAYTLAGLGIGLGAAILLDLALHTTSTSHPKGNTRLAAIAQEWRDF